jgi:hypothetical protein
LNEEELALEEGICWDLNDLMEKTKNARDAVECSPKSGPGAMRVSEALRGQETNHETTHG